MFEEKEDDTTRKETRRKSLWTCLHHCCCSFVLYARFSHTLLYCCFEWLKLLETLESFLVSLDFLAMRTLNKIIWRKKISIRLHGFLSIWVVKSNSSLSLLSFDLSNESLLSDNISIRVAQYKRVGFEFDWSGKFALATVE